MPYTRITNKRPGFDCRAGDCPSCKAGNRADHGIRSEAWFFTAVIGVEAALTFHVSTPYYPESIQPSSSLDRCYYNLDTCLAWPNDIGSIAHPRTPGACEYIVKCYAGDGFSGSSERAFAEKYFDLSAGLQQSDKFWDALHQLLRHTMDTAAKYRHMSQCVHCLGNGVVALDGNGQWKPVAE